MKINTSFSLFIHVLFQLCFIKKNVNLYNSINNKLKNNETCTQECRCSLLLYVKVVVDDNKPFK